MATQVIKKDGTKESFNEDKVSRSIQLACQDAALDEARTQEVLHQVLPVVLKLAASKEEIAASELKDAALAQLDKAEPTAAGAWRKHTKE
jgi:transcriptional regulator NrdR family protein